MAYKAMLHGWVKSKSTGRVGQVRGVGRDPETGEQNGVYVKVWYSQDKRLSFWPSGLITPSKRPRKRRHGKR